ncbi:MAG: hypothetical protein AAB513_01760 [Patescibacteria group bacterium]
MSVSIKEQALLMRKNGATYSEISLKLKLSRGLLSKWFQGITLSPLEKEGLLKHQKEVILRSRNKSKLSRQMKKVFGERQALVGGQKSFKKFQSDTRFLVGLSMYLSHGSFGNSYLQFSSSDEEVVQIFLDWLIRFLGVPVSATRCRIYINNNISHLEAQSAWIRKIAINDKQFLKPVIYKTRQKTKENGSNKGFLQISVSGINNIRTLNVWKKLILSYYHQVKR